jgi:hypothetical protein
MEDEKWVIDFGFWILDGEGFATWVGSGFVGCRYNKEKKFERFKR